MILAPVLSLELTPERNPLPRRGRSLTPLVWSLLVAAVLLGVIVWGAAS